MKNRYNDGDSEAGPGPIRDIVNDDGPMGKKKTKSVDFGAGTTDIRKTVTSESRTQPLKIQEIDQTEYNLGNEKLNTHMHRIREGYQHLAARVVTSPFPDGRSDKGSRGRNSIKKSMKARPTNPDMTKSFNLGSINDSNNMRTEDALSGDLHHGMSGAMQSQTLFLDKSQALSFKKIKARQFNLPAQHYKMLVRIGADKYDQFDDLLQISLRCEEILNKMKFVWKTVDEAAVKDRIKRVMIKELNRLEERKQSKRFAMERAEREKAKRERMEDQAIMETSAYHSNANKSMMSPSKGGVNFDQQTSASSPYKKSPTKFGGSETDNGSQMTGYTGNSPSKFEGFGAEGFAGGKKSIEEIVARYNIKELATKGGMASKDLAKLGRGGGQSNTAMSQTGRSVGSRSRKTGGPGTMSRKSKAETDWEEMDIDEIDIRIEEQEIAVAKEQRQLNIIMSDKYQKTKTGKQIQEESKPLKANIHFRIKYIAMLYEVKDVKIPFYEKLPKDHMFYKHLMTAMGFKRMKNAANDKAEENKILFEDAREKLLQDQANA